MSLPLSADIVATYNNSGAASSLLESVVDNLLGVINEFQQGVGACDFKDGDLAARNGHIHIAKQVAVVFTQQAMVLAAARGHLEMVAYLHDQRNEGSTGEAMDLAATFGHLDMVQWLHFHRKEGCTTRAMDGAARNAHISVSQEHVCARPSSREFLSLNIGSSRRRSL